MARLRSNNVFGTVTDDPLLVGATTLNADGLANLVAVAGTDTAVLTLDPNRVNGAPEIVHVTAHTGSATSATILRGQEGTVAREHPAGTFWVHAATVVDFGAWANYTPTDVNVTVGNGTRAARFCQIGNTVHFEWQLTWGSATLLHATAASEIGLPVVGSVSPVTLAVNVSAVAVDANGVERVLGAHKAGSGARVRPVVEGGTFVTLTSPFTWATGDILLVAGSYEAA